MNRLLSSNPDITQWHRKTGGLALFFLVSCLFVSACSGSGSSAETPLEQLGDDPIGSEPEPAVLAQLRADPALIAPVPEVAHTQTLANTGLQVAYTHTSLVSLAPAALIEQQWVFMQTCVEQISVAPLVLVRQGPAVPLTPADDVVRNESALALEITSVPVASASILYGPVIQISDSDFDGSLGNPGFNLRSIMGRHLWLSNQLPERDYPFECARDQP